MRTTERERWERRDHWQAVWCGVALGYPDTTKPVNQLVTERAPGSAFASFRGFESNNPSTSQPISKL